ncbi:MAG: O-antigen ligase family protein [Pyrinomonadaceae bacterium]
MSKEPAIAGYPTAAHFFAGWLDRVLTGCLFALAFCAPHSIAATQTAWTLGLLVWVARFFVSPRPRLHRTPVDYALLGLFILTFVSSLLSYNPEISIGKLRAASLFTIVYLVAQNVRTWRTAKLLAFTLIASCMINVIYTAGRFAVGRGVKIEGTTADSPLRAWGWRDGDTVLEVDKRPVRNLDELRDALAAGLGDQAPTARARVYHVELFTDAEWPRGRLLPGHTAAAQLGVTNWSRGRDERAAGFYGHYTTYAEVLQLTGSLALGLFVGALRWRPKNDMAGRGRAPAALWFGAVVAGLGVALLLTVTRASWASFLVSAVLIALVGAWSRRVALLVALGVLLVVPAGLYVLQQKRQVGFFDRKDGSTTWRMTVYREGFDILLSKPRHLLVGVGMDTLKRRWREWGMFDGGRLPVGHLHSTPLQLAFERGVPALLAWLALLFLYARMLWRLARQQGLDWAGRGLALGALGGAAGFFTSGLVHYNLGDSEVAMVFYLIMGLALALDRHVRLNPLTETVRPK